MKQFLILSLLIFSCGSEQAPVKDDNTNSVADQKMSSTLRSLDDTTWVVSKQYTQGEPSHDFAYTIEWKKKDSSIIYYADSKFQDTFIAVVLRSMTITDGKQEVVINFSNYKKGLPSFSYDYSNVDISKIVSVFVGDDIIEPNDHFDEKKKTWILDASPEAKKGLDSVIKLIFPKKR